MNTDKPSLKVSYPSRLEVLVDFYDDMFFADSPLRAEDIDHLFARFAEHQIKTVSWYYHADDRGGWIHRFEPSHGEPSRSKFQVYQECCVMEYAAKVAHKYGMRYIIAFKPYETGFCGIDVETAAKQGINTVMQGGRMITGIDPFVVQRPDLRMRLRPSLRNLDPMVTVGKIELWKADDAPTPIQKENLEFFSSETNFHYQPMPCSFDFSEEIRTNPQEERDLFGNIIMPAGAPVRVLVLDNLNFSARFWAIRCKGLTGEGTFKGLGTRIMRVYDKEGHPLDGCYAGKRTICDSEHNDLEHSPYFDFGYGRMPQTFDAPGEYIAFTASRPEYITGALCETEPEVQEFWLQCIEKMLAAGVDGVEFRIENHSHMTDHIYDYGFNDAVLKLAGEDASDEQIAKIRGDAYTDFLKKAAALIRKAGKVIRLNISIDRLTVPLPEDRLLAWPMGVEYQWKRWLKENLTDEVVFRVFNRFMRPKALSNPLTGEVTGECKKYGIPVVFSHYFLQYETPWNVEESERILRDSRFDGLCLYECSSLFHLDEKGHWEYRPNVLESLRRLEKLAYQ